MDTVDKIILGGIGMFYVGIALLDWRIMVIGFVIMMLAPNTEVN